MHPHLKYIKVLWTTSTHRVRKSPLNEFPLLLCFFLSLLQCRNTFLVVLLLFLSIDHSWVTNCLMWNNFSWTFFRLESFVWVLDVSSSLVSDSSLEESLLEDLAVFLWLGLTELLDLLVFSLVSGMVLTDCDAEDVLEVKTSSSSLLSDSSPEESLLEDLEVFLWLGLIELLDLLVFSLVTGLVFADCDAEDLLERETLTLSSSLLLSDSSPEESLLEDLEVFLWLGLFGVFELLEVTVFSSVSGMVLTDCDAEGVLEVKTSSLLLLSVSSLEESSSEMDALFSSVFEAVCLFKVDNFCWEFEDCCWLVSSEMLCSFNFRSCLSLLGDSGSIFWATLFRLGSGPPKRSFVPMKAGRDMVFTWFFFLLSFSVVSSPRR